MYKIGVGYMTKITIRVILFHGNTIHHNRSNFISRNNIYHDIVIIALNKVFMISESESEWALLARYVYTYEEFVIVTKLHSATEWQQQDRTQTTKEQYTNIQIGNVQNSKNTMQYRQSCVYRSDMCKFEMEKNKIKNIIYVCVVNK